MLDLTLTFLIQDTDTGTYPTRYGYPDTLIAITRD
jgi:hypothetical protein